MGFFKFFKREEDHSAVKARDRLQVLIAHERTSRNGPDYLPRLKRDILAVIKKYVNVSDDALSVQLENGADCDVLELNIALPEETQGTKVRGAVNRTGRPATVTD